MRPPAAGLLLAAIVGCSTLPADGDGIVALQIRTQSPLSLHQGEEAILRARALDQKGDSVPALIRWYTADTASLTLDSLSGIVVARKPSGSAKVQAAVGTLRSDPITITLLPPLSAGLRSH